ncbi:MAG TPA: undecaprenyldiphospho-muramoylpentapeptide beta-N-acetylglucosaminyltransferase [Oculatellaceae cyanobacterium]
MSHRIVLTGGGTGGHIYPALAVAEQLAKDSDIEAILYIGAKGHLEERLAKERNLDFLGLNVSGMPRGLSPKLFTWPLETFGALVEAINVVKRFRPTAVLGTGGYASAPPLAAAMALQVPFIVHEPDSFPGKVNKLFAPFAALCSLGMELAKDRLPVETAKLRFNGNPIRASFFKKTSRKQAASQFKLSPDLPTLLITGGSQGAQAINESLRVALPRLMDATPPIQIIHQVGEKNFDAFKKQLDSQWLNHDRYKLLPYIDDLSVAYALADVALCRAGAMTIAELTATHKPAIFIPYPYAAQNHQMHNGRFMESKGAAIVIPQDALNADKMGDTILGLLHNSETLSQMQQAAEEMAKPNAASEIAKQLKILGGSSSG